MSIMFRKQNVHFHAKYDKSEMWLHNISNISYLHATMKEIKSPVNKFLNCRQSLTMAIKLAMAVS